MQIRVPSANSPPRQFLTRSVCQYQSPLANYVPLYELPKPTPFGTLWELQITKCIGKLFSNVAAVICSMDEGRAVVRTYQSHAPIYWNVTSRPKCTVSDADPSMPENHKDAVPWHHVWSAALTCVPSIIEIRRHYAGTGTKSQKGDTFRSGDMIRQPLFCC